MIFGMTLSTFTLVHVLLSLVGIGSGLIVLLGLIAGKQLDRWAAVFLASTIATCLTGYAFPFVKLTPAHVFGVLTLLAMALAILARYTFHLSGVWRRTYIASASTALYLNMCILVLQAVQKAPALSALAPTQSEAPFVIAQLPVLALCIALAILAGARFRDIRVRPA